MEHTPIYLAGQTARLLNLPIELARNRTGDSQKTWLNGYASAVPLQTQVARNRRNILSKP
jgi:hypothetical protein